MGETASATCAVVWYRVQRTEEHGVVEYESTGGKSVSVVERLAKAHPSVVTRLNRTIGAHAAVFHDERVQDLEVVALEADERHSSADDKSQPQWETAVIDPVSKFVVSHVQGQRNAALIRRLLEDAVKRLAER